MGCTSIKNIEIQCKLDTDIKIYWLKLWYRLQFKIDSLQIVDLEIQF